jgi:soluble lytic murein transglycosylase
MRQLNLQILFTILFLAYQNFAVTDIKGFSPIKINEFQRQKDAKQFLGPSYNLSYAKKAENSLSLHKKLNSFIQKKLHTEYSKKSFSLTETIIKEAQVHNLDPVLIASLIYVESKYDPMTVGAHGEIGLMQIKPSTAQWLAKKYKLKFTKNDLFVPEKNVKIGILYLAYLRSRIVDHPQKFITAYNMGESRGKKFTTSTYLRKVLTSYNDSYSYIIKADKI